MRRRGKGSSSRTVNGPIGQDRFGAAPSSQIPRLPTAFPSPHPPIRSTGEHIDLGTPLLTYDRRKEPEEITATKKRTIEVFDMPRGAIVTAPERLPTHAAPTRNEAASVCTRAGGRGRAGGER